LADGTPQFHTALDSRLRNPEQFGQALNGL